MGIHTIKLPDVGEGVAEAELVEWSVAPGDFVGEDQIVAAVMTDKATVEIPSPVAGTVVWIGGKIGETVAVGADLIRIETDIAKPEATAPGDMEPPADITPALPVATSTDVPEQASPDAAEKAVAPQPREHKPLAAPAVRGQSREAGVDLHAVPGTGPEGRITHADLSAYLSGGGTAPDEKVREIPVIGLRRKIAERMAEAVRRIPHITLVEEVDVTALEEARERLNAGRREGRPKLTLLPFLMAAIVRAVKAQPALNAHYDDAAGVIRQFAAVHIGIATQTAGGLMVPVVRHCEALSIWAAAEEVQRLADAARDGSAGRAELMGSTITISSLGALGAIAATPIINAPEVAIVGVNRMEIRPSWNGSAFVPRKKMNLSSSFDHRVIDGWDAALFVKRLKDLLETPTLIFVDD